MDFRYIVLIFLLFENIEIGKVKLMWTWVDYKDINLSSNIYFLKGRRNEEEDGP